MQIPLFQTKIEWFPPERIPDLSEAKEIAIDLETRDSGLSEGVGPGWAVSNGYRYISDYGAGLVGHHYAYRRCRILRERRRGEHECDCDKQSETAVASD